MLGVCAVLCLVLFCRSTPVLCCAVLCCALPGVGLCNNLLLDLVLVQTSSDVSLCMTVFCCAAVTCTVCLLVTSHTALYQASFGVGCCAALHVASNTWLSQVHEGSGHLRRREVDA